MAATAVERRRRLTFASGDGGRWSDARMDAVSFDVATVTAASGGGGECRIELTTRRSPSKCAFSHSPLTALIAAAAAAPATTAAAAVVKNTMQPQQQQQLPCVGGECSSSTIATVMTTNSTIDMEQQHALAVTMVAVVEQVNYNMTLPLIHLIATLIFRLQSKNDSCCGFALSAMWCRQRCVLRHFLFFAISSESHPYHHHLTINCKHFAANFGVFEIKFMLISSLALQFIIFAGWHWLRWSPSTFTAACCRQFWLKQSNFVLLQLFVGWLW